MQTMRARSIAKRYVKDYKTEFPRNSMYAWP